MVHSPWWLPCTSTFFPPPPIPPSFASPLSASKRAALFRTIVGKRQSVAARLIVSCRGKRLQALLAEHPDAFHFCGTLRKFDKNKRVKTSCLLQRRTIPRDGNKRGEWEGTRNKEAASIHCFLACIFTRRQWKCQILEICLKSALWIFAKERANWRQTEVTPFIVNTVP